MRCSLHQKKSSRDKDRSRYGSLTKCTTAIERAIQISTFEEVLKVHSMNNNKLRRGDMKEIIMESLRHKLFCVTKQNLDYCYCLYMNGIAGRRTDNLPTTALVMQISALVMQILASVWPPPPVSIIEYDDEVSCLTNPSSWICSDSNKSNNTNNKDVSGGQKKDQQ
jgi:hypothetical protein